MAKSRAPSKHSRAARRATSPGIDTDKSLKDIKPPSRSSGTDRPSVLAAHQSAGVQKKTKKKSQMSSKARKRHERGLQMAEAVAERTSKKLEKSKGRGRVVQYRSKRWEDINKDADKAEAVADEDESDDSEDNDDGKAAKGDKGWETDEEMDAKDEELKETAPAVQPPSEEAQGYLAVDNDGDIL